MAQAPDSGRLFQEDLRDEPFWMLTTCILINRTHWRQVRPMLEKLRARGDGPSDMLKVPIEELIEIIRPLGFYNRRASTLRRFWSDWVRNPPFTSEMVARMYGCGDYAVQSYMIFVEGKAPQTHVADHKLQWYLEKANLE